MYECVLLENLRSSEKISEIVAMLYGSLSDRQLENFRQCLAEKCRTGDDSELLAKWSEKWIDKIGKFNFETIQKRLLVTINDKGECGPLFKKVLIRDSRYNGKARSTWSPVLFPREVSDIITKLFHHLGAFVLSLRDLEKLLTESLGYSVPREVLLASFDKVIRLPHYDSVLTTGNPVVDWSEDTQSSGEHQVIAISHDGVDAIRREIRMISTRDELFYEYLMQGHIKTFCPDVYSEVQNGNYLYSYQFLLETDCLTEVRQNYDILLGPLADQSQETIQQLVQSEVKIMVADHRVCSVRGRQSYWNSFGAYSSPSGNPYGPPPPPSFQGLDEDRKKRVSDVLDCNMQHARSNMTELEGMLGLPTTADAPYPSIVGVGYLGESSMRQPTSRRLPSISCQVAGMGSSTKTFAGNTEGWGQLFGHHQNLPSVGPRMATTHHQAHVPPFLPAVGPRMPPTHHQAHVPPFLPAVGPRMPPMHHQAHVPPFLPAVGPRMPPTHHQAHVPPFLPAVGPRMPPTQYSFASAPTQPQPFGPGVPPPEYHQAQVPSFEYYQATVSPSNLPFDLQGYGTEGPHASCLPAMAGFDICVSPNANVGLGQATGALGYSGFGEAALVPLDANAFHHSTGAGMGALVYSTTDDMSPTNSTSSYRTSLPSLWQWFRQEPRLAEALLRQDCRALEWVAFQGIDPNLFCSSLEQLRQESSVFVELRQGNARDSSGDENDPARLVAVSFLMARSAQSAAGSTMAGIVNLSRNLEDFKKGANAKSQEIEQAMKSHHQESIAAQKSLEDKLDGLTQLVANLEAVADDSDDNKNAEKQQMDGVEEKLDRLLQGQEQHQDSVAKVGDSISSMSDKLEHGIKKIHGGIECARLNANKENLPPNHKQPASHDSGKTKGFVARNPNKASVAQDSGKTTSFVARTPTKVSTTRDTRAAPCSTAARPEGRSQSISKCRNIIEQTTHKGYPMLKIGFVGHDGEKHEQWFFVKKQPYLSPPIQVIKMPLKAGTMDFVSCCPTRSSNICGTHKKSNETLKELVKDPNEYKTIFKALRKLHDEGKFTTAA